MISDERISVDIEGAEEEDIDRFLDALYLGDYMTPEGYAPSFSEMREQYLNECGYEPTMLACYADEDGNAVVEPADWFSSRGKELIVLTRNILWLGEAYPLVGLE